MVRGPLLSWGDLPPGSLVEDAPETFFTWGSWGCWGRACDVVIVTLMLRAFRRIQVAALMTCGCHIDMNDHSGMARLCG